MFDYTFHWRSAFNALPAMLQGSLVTIETAVITMVLGTLIAFALTAMRSSNIRVLRGFSATWISIARNTPSLLQIYMLYFGLGNFNIHCITEDFLTEDSADDFGLCKKAFWSKAHPAFGSGTF